MKLNELMEISDLNEEQLNEISVKQVIAAGAIALATLGVFDKRLNDKAEAAKEIAAAAEKEAKARQSKEELHQKYLKLQQELNGLAKVVKAKYKVDDKQALAYAAIAKEYEKPTFPKAKDILTVMGIESSLNVNAQSNLKKDPAIGVMQVRPKMWGLNPSELRGNLRLQVEKGSEILHKLYNRVHDEEKALMAYNIGPKNLEKGEKDMMDAAKRYVAKFRKEKKEYEGV